MRRVLPAWARDQALNIGHRGARALAPENTLEGIAKAKTAGADMVELDVHLSRDGIPVVVHDDELTQHTDVQARFPDRAPWFVSQFTAVEITSLDAGSRFAGPRQVTGAIDELVTEAELAQYRAGAVHPPTLRDALERAKTLRLLVNIELKTLPRRYAGLGRTVVDLVRTLHMIGDVLLSSFDHQELLDVRARDDRIATAVLTRDRLAMPVKYVRDLCGAQALHPCCSGDADSLGLDSVSGSIDRATIDALREAGLLVNVWTENDPARMKALIDAGVTGIVTDYPNRLARVLDARRRDGYTP
jgi:glycerophosphoryl diester phosphodiesterase